MPRVLPHGLPAVRPLLILSAAAIALLPSVPAKAQKPAYDATQVWQDAIPPEAVTDAPNWNATPVPLPAPTVPAPAPPVPAEPPAPPQPEAFPAAPPASGTVTVSWDAPTERIDDSPLENLAGFRVYYGTAPGAYTSKLEVNAPSLTSVVISSLPAGTYWFVVTAYDAEGLESVYSEAASKYVAS